MRADQLDNVLRTSAAAIAEAVDSTPAQQVARPPINADFISVSQVAKLLKLERTALWARVQRKSFPAPSMKSGRQAGYRIAEIDAYLAKLETK